MADGDTASPAGSEVYDDEDGEGKENPQKHCQQRWNEEEHARLVQLVDKFGTDRKPNIRRGKWEPEEEESINKPNIRRGKWEPGEEESITKNHTYVGPNIRRGKWEPEEEESIAKYQAYFGSMWSKTESISRATLPNIRRGKWEPEEEESIAKYHAYFGSMWSKIAKHIEGRSENSIKNLYMALSSRMLAVYVGIIRSGTATGEEALKQATAIARAAQPATSPRSESPTRSAEKKRKDLYKHPARPADTKPNPAKTSANTLGGGGRGSGGGGGGNASGGSAEDLDQPAARRRRVDGPGGAPGHSHYTSSPLGGTNERYCPHEGLERNLSVPNNEREQVSNLLTLLRQSEHWKDGRGASLLNAILPPGAQGGGPGQGGAVRMDQLAKGVMQDQRGDYALSRAYPETSSARNNGQMLEGYGHRVGGPHPGEGSSLLHMGGPVGSSGSYSLDATQPGPGASQGLHSAGPHAPHQAMPGPYLRYPPDAVNHHPLPRADSHGQLNTLHTLGGGGGGGGESSHHQLRGQPGEAFELSNLLQMLSRQLSGGSADLLRANSNTIHRILMQMSDQMPNTGHPEEKILMQMSDQMPNTGHPEEKAEARSEARPDARHEVWPEVRPEGRYEGRPEPRHEVRPEARHEVRHAMYPGQHMHSNESLPLDTDIALEAEQELLEANVDCKPIVVQHGEREEANEDRKPIFVENGECREREKANVDRKLIVVEHGERREREEANTDRKPIFTEHLERRDNKQGTEEAGRTARTASPSSPQHDALKTSVRTGGLAKDGLGPPQPSQQPVKSGKSGSASQEVLYSAFGGAVFLQASDGQWETHGTGNIPGADDAKPAGEPVVGEAGPSGAGGRPGSQGPEGRPGEERTTTSAAFASAGPEPSLLKVTSSLFDMMTNLTSYNSQRGMGGPTGGGGASASPLDRHLQSSQAGFPSAPHSSLPLMYSLDQQQQQRMYGDRSPERSGRMNPGPSAEALLKELLKEQHLREQQQKNATAGAPKLFHYAGSSPHHMGQGPHQMGHESGSQLVVRPNTYRLSNDGGGGQHLLPAHSDGFGGGRGHSGHGDGLGGGLGGGRSHSDGGGHSPARLVDNALLASRGLVSVGGHQHQPRYHDISLQGSDNPPLPNGRRVSTQILGEGAGPSHPLTLSSLSQYVSLQEPKGMLSNQQHLQHPQGGGPSHQYSAPSWLISELAQSLGPQQGHPQLGNPAPGLMGQSGGWINRSSPHQLVNLPEGFNRIPNTLWQHPNGRAVHGGGLGGQGPAGTQPHIPLRR
eukprot:gene31676-6878_t